jgi:hypothetical protein
LQSKLKSFIAKPELKKQLKKNAIIEDIININAFNCSGRKIFFLIISCALIQPYLLKKIESICAKSAKKQALLEIVSILLFVKIKKILPIIAITIPINCLIVILLLYKKYIQKDEMKGSNVPQKAILVGDISCKAYARRDAVKKVVKKAIKIIVFILLNKYKNIFFSLQKNIINIIPDIPILKNTNR